MTEPPVDPHAPASLSADDAAAHAAAAISRQLRGTVLALSSAAQLVRYGAHDDPVLDRNIGRVLREVERLNTTLAALREYAELPPPTLANANPDAAVDEAIAEGRALLESAALRVQRRRASPQAVVRGDLHQLARAFAHLLRAVAEGAPPGSDIAVTARHDAGGTWSCELHDDGPAIPGDVIPQVFDLFAPARSEHAGVDLAIAHRIVRAHHGRIAVRSDAGAGTTFEITLPVAG